MSDVPAGGFSSGRRYRHLAHQHRRRDARLAPCRPRPRDVGASVHGHGEHSYGVRQGALRYLLCPCNGDDTLVRGGQGIMSGGRYRVWGRNLKFPENHEIRFSGSDETFGTLEWMHVIMAGL